MRHKKYSKALLGVLLCAAVLAGCGKIEKVKAPEIEYLDGENAEAGSAQKAPGGEEGFTDGQDGSAQKAPGGEEGSTDGQDGSAQKASGGENTSTEKDDREAEKKDSTSEDNLAVAEKAYLEFLQGEGTVTTAEVFGKDDKDGNWDCLNYGTYSFTELQKTIAEAEFGDNIARYTFLDLPKEGQQRETGAKIKILFLRFENQNDSGLHWTGVIRYEEGKLVLDSYYEDGYRSEATLYESGYLVHSGSNGAGDQVTNLSCYDAQGNHMERSMRILYSSYAVYWIYEIDPQGNGPQEDYSEMSSDFMIRTCIDEKQDKYLSVESRGTSKAEQELEDALLTELEKLGVKQISPQEMDRFFDLSDYMDKEVTWLTL